MPDSDQLRSNLNYFQKSQNNNWVKSHVILEKISLHLSKLYYAKTCLKPLNKLILAVHTIDCVDYRQQNWASLHDGAPSYIYSQFIEKNPIN